MKWHKVASLQTKPRSGGTKGVVKRVNTEGREEEVCVCVEADNARL